MNMTERVARAICLHDRKDPDQLTTDAPFEEMGSALERYLPMARAAIEAMGVPTDEMIAQAAIRLSIVTARGSHIVSDADRKLQVTRIFQAAINAALQEKS